MNAAARAVIERHGLAPLPGEGGWFRVTTRGAAASSILFLITPEDFSALHVIAQDEWWLFHAGDPVEHVQLDAAGALHRVRLGGGAADGETPQVRVPAGTLQGARLAPDAAAGGAAQGWALLSCVVSPPWEEAGWALPGRVELLRAWPAHAEMIRALTR
jgi:predicted cupin superfamily sugar epimerase